MTAPPPEPVSLPAAGATQVLIVPASPPHDPPPPYPTRERRRAGRSGRRRRTVGGELDQLQTTSIGNDSDGGPSTHSPYLASPDLEHHTEDASETTPLLSPSRLPPGGISRRQRAISVSSSLQSAVSAAPSFTHTVLSAFQPDRDCDLDPDEETVQLPEDHDLPDSPIPRPSIPDEQTRLFATELSADRISERRALSISSRIRRYFRPMARRAYYSSLFHLLVLNFPYALITWVYLFVFTLVSILSQPSIFVLLSHALRGSSCSSLSAILDRHDDIDGASTWCLTLFPRSSRSSCIRQRRGEYSEPICSPRGSDALLVSPSNDFPRSPCFPSTLSSPPHIHPRTHAYPCGNRRWGRSARRTLVLSQRLRHVYGPDLASSTLLLPRH